MAGVPGCSTSSPKLKASRQQVSRPDPLRDAYLLYEMGKLEVAEQKLQAILQMDPHNPDAARLLGLVHEAERKRPAWGYYQTIPQQPIYQ